MTRSGRWYNLYGEVAGAFLTATLQTKSSESAHCSCSELPAHADHTAQWGSRAYFESIEIDIQEDLDGLALWASDAEFLRMEGNRGCCVDPLQLRAVLPLPIQSLNRIS